MLYHTASYSAMKASFLNFLPRGRKSGIVWVMVLCLPKLLLHGMEPGFCFTCLTMESGEWIPCLLCLHLHLLLYLLNCLYLKPWVFLILFLWFSPSSHQRKMSKQMYGAWLPVVLKYSNNSKNIYKITYSINIS